MNRQAIQQLPEGQLVLVNPTGMKRGKRRPARLVNVEVRERGHASGQSKTMVTVELQKLSPSGDGLVTSMRRVWQSDEQTPAITRVPAKDVIEALSAEEAIEMLQHAEGAAAAEAERAAAKRAATERFAAIVDEHNAQSGGYAYVSSVHSDGTALHRITPEELELLLANRRAANREETSLD